MDLILKKMDFGLKMMKYGGVAGEEACAAANTAAAAVRDVPLLHALHDL